MTETLSFPGLGLEFELNRVAFTLFGQNIYWYGVLIAAAFLAGAAFVLRKAKFFGVDPDRMMDVIFGGVLLGIVGARLYYVFLKWDTYKNDLALIFNVRTGGLAIYGGVIGAVIGAYFICKWRKVKLFPALDAAAGGLFLAQAIGRWGNFVNIEAFGSNTTMPWGMTSPSIEWYLERNRAALSAVGMTVDPQMPVHPTFLYESIWCLLGFGLIMWYSRRRKFDGEIFLVYLGWYGLGRFFIEGLRTDSLAIGAIRVSQIVALLCVVFAAATILTVRSRIKREGDPAYLQLYVKTEEGRKVVAGEFYQAKDPKSEEEPATAEENPSVSDGDEQAEESADSENAQGEPGNHPPTEDVSEGAAEQAEDVEASPPEEEPVPDPDEKLEKPGAE